MPLNNVEETLNTLVSLTVRQGTPERSRRAHHERYQQHNHALNQQLSVRPEPVRGLDQNLRKEIKP
jgi:hypothetical protein